MRTSFANNWNAAVLDEYYAKWQHDPASVDEKWAAFFEGFALGSSVPPRGAAAAAKPAESNGAASTHQMRVDEAVLAYRTLGHTLAHLDPLFTKEPQQPLLTLEALGFTTADLDEAVSSRYFMGGKTMRLREMIAALQTTYAQRIGAEFMHIESTRVRNWVRERLESRRELPPASKEEQRKRYGHLLAAEAFERFLHTRYVGQKRFSLEGGEALITLLETVLERAAAGGVKELVMGMAHRGRLNVLANFLKKSRQMIFTEFSENYRPNLASGDGDVKYHLGYESVRHLEGGREVSVRLASNPSHLEAVDPVVQGKARARQRILQDTAQRKAVLPVLIHGDAAFAGQGVVAETLNMSQLPGYSTGGTIHLIINNQIGFTTLPADARSSLYCTDVAKMIDAPIFHVNGDDPEAVCFLAELAVDFRQQFGRDVIVDMYCYRRYGHNEGDEPNFTQPDLYARIEKQPSVATLYRNRLVESGRLAAEDAAAMLKEYDDECEAALQEVKAAAAANDGAAGPSRRKAFEGSTAIFQPPYSHAPVETAITLETLEKIARAVTHVPENIRVLPKLKRNLLDRRLKVFEAGGPYDWSFAETLAIGSLLLDCKPVRLSGQDSRRGTFSQRQSVLYDAETRERYIPLNNLAREQARFCVYNSPLSEAAVLGFDYGYSLDYPSMLCLWEAQFGDFINGAQVIIDQFIVSAESKWQRPSGIVLLLPHGYEGMGPEHSSARLERFLQSCAEDNIQVCNLTTPAQYFHVLRRQISRPFLKPLVLMTPKSLLRSEAAVSYNDDFTKAHFEEILETPAGSGAAAAKRVIFCTGKVYYDLLKERTERKADDVALLRVEQLYPLHTERLKMLLAPYTQVERWVWCQEESQNMGAWTFIAPQLADLLNQQIAYAGRNASASPAVGAKSIHDREQRELVALAFGC